MSYEYSNDQYRHDFESRYPAFSDYNTTDQSLADPYGVARYNRPAKPGHSMTYENKYQAEQQDIPVYMSCHNKCVSAQWPRQNEMRPYTIEQKERALALAHDAELARCARANMITTPVMAPPQHQPQPQVLGAAQPQSKSTRAESMVGGITLDSNAIMSILMFILLITVCFCLKSIIELRSEVKKLRKADSGS